MLFERLNSGKANTREKKNPKEKVISTSLLWCIANTPVMLRPFASFRERTQSDTSETVTQTRLSR